MIYAGYVHFNDTTDKVDQVTSAINLLIPTNAQIIRKSSLVLCYGKISNEQDMDDVLENDTSILIGRAFDKEQHCTFSNKDFKDCTYLSAEETLKKIWGKYVFIKSHSESQSFEVVLDTTGQLPFFYYPFPDGSLLFASDIEIIFKVLRQKLEYNWEYLCSYLIYGNSSSIQTPFQNVFELPPACNLRITKNRRETTPFWSPISSYKKTDIQGQNAVEVLQKTLKPLIEPYNTICVSLSGGLDSSSLVYCLKDLVRKDQSLKALNYFHSQIQSSNELVHAREVCKRTGIELIEVDVSDSLPFDSFKRKQVLKPNKPFPGLVNLNWLDTVLNNISANDSFLFLSGDGSDHIFMRPPSRKSISDYILEKGFKGSRNQMGRITHFYRDPAFSIFKMNLKSLLSHFLGIRKERTHREEGVKRVPKWIRRELIKSNTFSYSHPIYEFLSKKIIPGKYDQIDAFYEGIASIHMETLNQGDPTVFPFLYEPVVEFALSFPTYELFSNGYDRYPLRKAVGDRFKTETVWRRDKSQTTGLFQLGVKRNLKHILERCLEGHFVKQGLVNKEGLHKTITLIGSGDTKNLWPFIYLSSVEIFLNLWDEKNL